MDTADALIGRCIESLNRNPNFIDASCDDGIDFFFREQNAVRCKADFFSNISIMRLGHHRREERVAERFARIVEIEHLELLRERFCLLDDTLEEFHRHHGLSWRL